MKVEFKHHDTLRLFVEIAQHSSLSGAAQSLNMTKGAISYQIKVLESGLGFKVFERTARGVVLTSKGRQLLQMTRPSYLAIEGELMALKDSVAETLTVGMSTYFASRWLSPRLMTFMQKYPEIQLRIQPMTRLFDLEGQGVDIAIRWGDGGWNDAEISPFMPLPSWPVGDAIAARKVKEEGLGKSFSNFTLIRDHDDSNAWSDWCKIAGVTPQIRKDTLIVPDPNVRMQMVINGQGIALADDLVTRDLERGELFRLSRVELSSYGYFLARSKLVRNNRSIEAFVSWLQRQ